LANDRRRPLPPQEREIKRIRYIPGGIALVGGIALAAIASTAQAKPQSERSKFVEACHERVLKHDPSVYQDCYTPDFVLMGGPETYAAPDRRLGGRNAVRGMMLMGGGDMAAFEPIEQNWEDLAESDNRLVRRLLYIMKRPKVASYAGFTDLPRDLEVPCDIIIVYTFWDGKISSQFAQYDSLGFLLDLAQGNPQKVAAALTAMKPLMDAMKSGVVPEMPPAPPAAQK